MANDTMFTQGSRNEAILTEIINVLDGEQAGELPPPQSRVEVLLQAMLNRIGPAEWVPGTAVSVVGTGIVFTNIE